MLVPSVRAEPIPDYVLDRDYVSCMGGEHQDQERAAYCSCVRDGMRGWDLETYASIAMEQSKAASAQQVPQKIGDIAKACINKVLKP